MSGARLDSASRRLTIPGAAGSVAAVALLGRAVRAFWHDIAAGGDDDFNHWHTEEHIPERVGIPGFLRGRRYEVLGEGPRYFNLYETADLDVLGSPAYVE